MTSWPPFPREIEADARAAGLRERLESSARRLWRDSATVVPVVRADPVLGDVLARAEASRMLVLGLEAASAALDREEAGLAALAARGGSARAQRISRVLLLANDGAERFYRAADSVTRRHAARLLTCRLDVPASALGQAVLGRAAGVKAVLVQHKTVVADVLRALAGAADRGLMLEYLRYVVDPSAPVPAGWPQGWYGVLLLFCIPGGVGIPSGVLLGQREGLGAPAMTMLYFASDVVLAAVFEPMLRLAAIVGRRVPMLDRMLRIMLRVIAQTMPAGSLAGPTGVILTGFGCGLPFGRAIAWAAGYGLVASWLLTIAGDMLYYALGMASTLWFEGLLGDQRMAVLAAIIVMLVVSGLVRRSRTTG